MNANDVVIVSAVRTPFGKFDGVLKSILSMDLGVCVLKEVVSRIGLNPAQVDEVYYGTCIPAEYAIFTNVPARQITLRLDSRKRIFRSLSIGHVAHR